MMSEHSHAVPHGDYGAHDDHGGVGKYITVFVALCVLTSASFFTYSSAWPFHDTPAVGWAFMMAVSCTKAMLVMLFFMHLKWEASWKYVLTIPAALMSIFLMLVLVPDIGLRLRRASEERRSHMATETTVATLQAESAHAAEAHGTRAHGSEAHDTPAGQKEAEQQPH